MSCRVQEWRLQIWVANVLAKQTCRFCKKGKIANFSFIAIYRATKLEFWKYFESEMNWNICNIGNGYFSLFRENWPSNTIQYIFYTLKIALMSLFYNSVIICWMWKGFFPPTKKSRQSSFRCDFAWKIIKAHWY